jgi:hypothetical protein
VPPRIWLIAVALLAGFGALYQIARTLPVDGEAKSREMLEEIQQASIVVGMTPRTASESAMRSSAGFAAVSIPKVQWSAENSARLIAEMKRSGWTLARGGNAMCKNGMLVDLDSFCRDCGDVILISGEYSRSTIEYCKDGA